MKDKEMKTFVFLMALLMVSSGLTAQIHKDPKFGPDSASRMDCARNKSLYSEFFKQNNFEDALTPWYAVFHNCPMASQNTFIDGIKIIKYFIDKETNPAKQSALVDTLMKIYDQRIRYFGREGYNLGRKGVDLLRYKSQKIEDIEIAYQILERSISLSGISSERAVLVTYMSANESMFKGGKITQDQLINNYSTIIDILDQCLKASPKDSSDIFSTRDNINIIFDRVAPPCDAIISLYEPKFNQSPNDPSILEFIVNMLGKRNCTKEDLYYKALVNYYKIKPSLAFAVQLAELSRQRDKNNDAINYYKQAIELETDNIVKSNYYLRIADIYRSREDYSNAREFARLAAEANPASGEPYMRIGYLYAMSAQTCGTSELEKGAVYWAVVDKFIRAKTIDPKLSDEADRNIATYSKYFPSKEELFYQLLKEGDSYQVKCWINETTTVRPRAN